MKLVTQINLLPILAVAIGLPSSMTLCWAVEPQIAAPSSAKAKFVDTAPLFKEPNPKKPVLPANSFPPTSSDCAKLNKKIQGLAPWERGYQQAMSGKRYKNALIGKSGAMQPENQACIEYTVAPFAKDSPEQKCCMDGFSNGYTNLAQLIDNYLLKKLPAPMTPQAKSCYHSFNLGRAAAKERCDENSPETINACMTPNIDKKVDQIGCAAWGYLAGLYECPWMKSDQEALMRSVGVGAVFNGALPPNKDPETDGLIAPAGKSKSGGASAKSKSI